MIHERDLVSDRPGRVVNATSGAHQAYEPKVRASELQRRLQPALRAAAIKTLRAGHG